MPNDPEIRAHQEWLGYVQPVGLVVSTPALLAAQAYVNKNIVPEHQRFLGWVEPVPMNDDDALAVADLPGMFADVFDWQPGDLVGGNALDALEVVLPEYGETLRPDYAVREIEPEDAAASPWMMLAQLLPTALDLDKVHETDEHRWQASPHARFERLLRETKVPVGLLCNGTHLRLVYAPRGETSGWLTFPVDAMAQVDGRPIFTGMHLLLSAERLFTLPRKQRLPQLLAESRKYQNEVSTRLSEQVLQSLYELLRGFQAADDQSRGALLRDVLRDDPNHVYAGLLNVLLRLVFILYAEDRGLMPGHAVYQNHYGLTGLFEMLRADANRFPDTMDQRYGAWARLLALFRLIHDGARHGDAFRLPPRQGHLFNPDRYPFLEGRAHGAARQAGERLRPPLVSDGVVFRVLRNLLVLDGERLSYRTLDVEQIGSVYETIMGFSLETARGRSIAVKPKKKHGAPLCVNLDALLDVKPDARAKWLKDTADQTLTGEGLKALKDAASPEDLVAALGNKLSPTTPRIVPHGAMLLQPSDERRRSGSHYTPRTLTEPIVRNTLRPVLERLGDKPTPEQILELKVCDPAMGSGAFLVEACRQLADALVKAWHHHDCVPAIPPDEDEILFARRCAAQRCLYGVDKNPMAVDLAKLSLWLVTLARDHAFTFVDHALKCGDSLVGLTRQQIAAFHWQPEKTIGLFEEIIKERIEAALELRNQIQHAEESVNEITLRLMLKESQETLDTVRAIGDTVIAAFFNGAKPKERERLRSDALAAWSHALGKTGGKTRTDASETAAGGRDGAVPALPDSSLRAERSNLDNTTSQIAASGDRLTRNDDEPSPTPSDAGNVIPAQAGIHNTPGTPDATDWIPAFAGMTEGLSPFHWEIEFPEVFLRDNPGFDAFVGNPPFLGGTRISHVIGMAYFQWLVMSFPPCEHHCDLVAYFFRRAFDNLRLGACLGLIATNTISQGDTREGGLRTIIRSGGSIFSARRRFKWPGVAAVVVSTVHISRGDIKGNPVLDTYPVNRISAYLFDGSVDESPQQLTRNPYFSLGSKIYGQGFIFADGDPECTPVAERTRILERHPNWTERVPPYIVGEDINSDPEQRASRYVICLSDVDTAEGLGQWPELRDIVERKVKPEREALGSNPNNIPLKRKWWAYQAHRPELYSSLASKCRTLCTSRVGQALAFSFVPTGIIYSEAVVVFCLDSYSSFCSMQSRPHEIWARFFGSSMKDDLRYTPSDCFETFPFPKDFETNPALEAAGKEYYECRAALMVRNDEGLTKTYNRFHDPEETSPEIVRLRELHRAMDRVVLDAYGWTDLQPTCEFLLDYEEEDDEDTAPAKGRGRKKPWRYRWPDDVRDEVLARLLDLNRQYAEEERLSGAATEKRGRKKKSSTTKATKSTKKKEKGKKKDDQGDLF